MMCMQFIITPDAVGQTRSFDRSVLLFWREGL